MGMIGNGESVRLTCIYLRCIYTYIYTVYTLYVDTVHILFKNLKVVP